MNIKDDCILPVDIVTVKKYGIKKWQDRFSWPVSDKDFSSLCFAIENCFTKYINAEEEELSDLLLIQCSLRYEYEYFLHALKVANKIREKQGKILCSDETLWYRNTVSGSRINVRASGAEEIRRYPIGLRARSEIAKILRNVIYNINLFRWFATAKRGELVRIYRSISSLSKEYIKKSHSLFCFTTDRDWLTSRTDYNIPKSIMDNIARISSALARELKSIADSHEINLFDNHVKYFEELTRRSLINAAKMIHFAKDKVEKRKKVHLITASIGDFFSRALCINIRRYGGKIVSFAHGGNIGLYNTPSLAFSEFALSDEFIAYMRSNIELFKEIKKNNPPLRGNDVTIKSCDSDQFFRLWRRYRTALLPQKNKRVMIIGYPYAQWRRYHVAGGFWPIHLDLELRLVEILRKGNFYVIYKVHPDRIREAEGIFDDRVDKVVYKGYFEDCLDMADVFIFGDMRTTAFSIALCTEKPIICFKMIEEPFEPFSKPMELLKKRCSFICTKFDEKNRMIFEEKELLDLLTRRSEKPNTEFIEAYMFPERVKKKW